MAIIKSFKFTHPLLGIVALAFLASYKNDGGHLRAECHLIYADQSVSPTSVTIRFEKPPCDDGIVSVTEEVMCGLALDEAKLHFERYCNDQSEIRRVQLAHVTASEASPQDLLQAWVRQLFPKMHDLSFQAEFGELRNYIQSFTAYSPIKVRVL